MDRRTLLRRTGAIGALALAGCTGQAKDDPENSDGSNGSPDDGAGSDGGSGDDSTPTATPEPVTMNDYSFEVTGQGPANQQQGSADVEFDTENDRVVVTGTIVGSDGCKTAALDSVDFDAEESQVDVAVVTKNKEGSEDMACTQALVGIEYNVTIQFSGGVPTGASVSHDGDGVMGAAHGSSSASAPDSNSTDDS